MISQRKIALKMYLLSRIEDAQIKFESEGYPQYFLDALERARLLVIDYYGKGVSSNTLIDLVCPVEGTTHYVMIKDLYRGLGLVYIHSQRHNAFLAAQSAKTPEQIKEYCKKANEVAMRKKLSNKN